MLFVLGIVRHFGTKLFIYPCSLFSGAVFLCLVSSFSHVGFCSLGLLLCFFSGLGFIVCSYAIVIGCKCLWVVVML